MNSREKRIQIRIKTELNKHNINDNDIFKDNKNVEDWFLVVLTLSNLKQAFIHKLYHGKKNKNLWIITFSL